MGMFKDMLGADESLFKNNQALDTNFVPKLLPYREYQQREIVGCIKPLFGEGNGRNVFVYGPSGIGKTAAIKWVFRDLEEDTDEIVPVYINCWQKNTTFKVFLELCDVLGYKLTHNKKSDELFEIIKKMLNKSSVVFAFDEIDKAEDYDFLYTIMEEVYRKSILLITNHKDWLDNLDQRIKSRLLPGSLEFKPYNPDETRGILKQRVDYAFVENVFDDSALDVISNKSFELQDVRSGIHMLKEAGLAAESKASRKVLVEHAEHAVNNISEFNIVKSTDLEEEAKVILDIVKEHSGEKIGDIYKLYKDNKGSLAYKSFQRRVKKLEEDKFVVVKKTEGGIEGNTSMIYYKKAEKKLTDF